MKRHLLFLTVGIVALLASCSAASVASGTYNGTFSTYNNSGSGTATVTTVNDNTVNVTINGDGTHTFNNVSVSKLEFYGVVSVDFTASNSEASFSGNLTQVSGIKTCSLDIDSNSTVGYVHFTSTN